MYIVTIIFDQVQFDSESPMALNTNANRRNQIGTYFKSQMNETSFTKQIYHKIVMVWPINHRFIRANQHSQIHSASSGGVGQTYHLAYLVESCNSRKGR